jgi:hypothetical protein
MDIEKAYFSLPEVLGRWSILEDDLVYLAENDLVRLSIRVFNVLMELGNYDEEEDGARFRVPEEQRSFSGLLDLHACDVFHLFRSGEAHLSEFRSGLAGYGCLWDGTPPLYVVIGDLLLRRDERERYEIKVGFNAGKGGGVERTFIASRDFKEVRCNGQRFLLGPIQAEVVRALHQAAELGKPWQSGKQILSTAQSKSLRMADVFKSKGNWRDLIQSDGRGNYRLNVD